MRKKQYLVDQLKAQKYNTWKKKQEVRIYSRKIRYGINYNPNLKTREIDASKYLKLFKQEKYSAKKLIIDKKVG